MKIVIETKLTSWVMFGSQIAWSRSGDATFHEACWKMILSSSRAVKRQNIQVTI